MTEQQERLLQDIGNQLNGFQQVQMQKNAELVTALGNLGKAIATEETSRKQSLLLLKAELLKSLSETALAIKQDVSFTPQTSAPQVKQATPQSWLQKLLGQ